AAIIAGDVLARDGFPEDIVAGAGPAFNSRERAFDSRAIAADRVIAVSPNIIDPLAVLFVAQWDEVFDIRQEECVAVNFVLVNRQTLGGFSLDRREVELPTDAKWPVSSARIVGERQIRIKSGATTGQAKRNRDRGSAGDRIGGEFLADALDRAAALRKVDGRRSCSGGLRFVTFALA